MSSQQQRYSTARDPLRGFVTAQNRARPPRAATLLAEVLDTVEDAFCVCDSAGRIQHENPAFRQLVTRVGAVEPIRAQVRALARDAVATAPALRSSPQDSPAVVRSVEFSVDDVSYRLRASLLRSTSADPSAASILSLEVRQASAVLDRLRTTHRLTPREVKVVELLAEGHSNKSVAHILGVSIHTARHHTGRVLAKLGANGRAEIGALIRRICP